MWVVVAALKPMYQSDFSYYVIFTVCFYRVSPFSLIYIPFLTVVCLCVVPRDRVVSYSLGRRLPTDHVCGQLQFRFELTSSIHPGTPGLMLCSSMDSLP